MWILYGNESGEYDSFKTKQEALKAKRDRDKFNKEQGLGEETWDIYYEED